MFPAQEEEMKMYFQIQQSFKCPVQSLRDPQAPLDATTTLYQTIWLPVLMYGAETCTMTENNTGLQAADMKPLRSMLGKTRRENKKIN